MGRSPARRVIALLRRRPIRSAAAGLVLGALGWFVFCLPDTLFDSPYSIVVSDRSGKLLAARIAADGQWRFPPIADVPPRFAAALIAFEDKRFRWHAGVDPLAVLRAARQNLAAGHVVSGASTLTMQVIRLSRDNPPRTFTEKVLEALLASRLEIAVSKDEILALYAAHAPFGGNVVGLEAAAWRYFGRAPVDLSWAEAATLAVLPNSPALVHPGRERESLRKKRDALLRELAESGQIDARTLELALHEALPDAPRDLPQLAQHLLDTLAVANPSRSRFVVTLDAGLQRRMSDAVARHGEVLAAQGVHNAAALAIDNRSGEVVAYVGNTSYSDRYGESMDLVRRPRSTGSLLKPFLFALMLESGELLPQSLVPDIPSDFGGFRPENYDRQYRGAVRARDALAQSLNVPAVFMLREHGVARFQHSLEKLGMTTLFRAPEDYGLSLILGGSEGNLFELTGLYAHFARPALPDGWQPRVLADDREQSRPSRAQFSAGAAWLTVQALLEVNRPGNEQYWKTFSSSRRVAWKTGTSFGLRDGWAIAVTPRYTVGVWTGNASGEGRAGLTGSGMAAPLLFQLLAGLDTGGWFEKPQLALREIVVCKADGYLPANECETERAELPVDAHFARVSPHHQLVHLDVENGARVSSECARVADMEHRGWFVLPPLQEYFYRQSHADYAPLPQWDPGCTVVAGNVPFEIVYPMPGSRIYIPDDFGAARSRVVFSATHRDPGARLYWHIDAEYVGTTGPFHELALDLPAGRHELVLVDEQGFRETRRFEILAKDKQALDPNSP